MMTEFISRRLMAMPPMGATIRIKPRGGSRVDVCSVKLADHVFTRVRDEHSIVHFEGDVDAYRAAQRFLEGEG
jgi:hypothetical protein